MATEAATDEGKRRGSGTQQQEEGGEEAEEDMEALMEAVARAISQAKGEEAEIAGKGALTTEGAALTVATLTGDEDTHVNARQMANIFLQGMGTP